MVNFVDVRDFGATGDGTTDDTAAFNRASEHAFVNRGVLVARGEFMLKGRVNIFSDCDFSQARVIIDSVIIDDVTYGGGFTVMQPPSSEGEERELTLESKDGDFDPAGLTYLKTSLKGVVNPDILARFANSFVRISSDAVHVYRRDGESLPAAQLKSTVTLLNDHGRLSYSLTHDFTPSPGQTNVQIILRKLPSKRLRFIAPELQILSVKKNSAVLDIRRDLTDVIGFTCTSKIATTTDNLYDGLLSCGPCYDVTVRGASFPGYGAPLNEPEVARKVMYDFVLSNALKVRFDSINSNTGWKTIDGNNARDIVVSNSVIDSFHGHYNVADVLVTGSTIQNLGLSFGTGCADSTITVRDCKFITRSRNPLAMRSDYGELRGSYVIENCIFDLRDSLIDPGEITLLTLVDRAINRQDQPGTYSLPSRIVIRDISIASPGDCNLIAFNTSKDVYGPSRRLEAPRVIMIDGVDATGVGGALRFTYGFIPYNADSSEPVSVRIANVAARGPASPFVVKFTSTPDEQVKLHYRVSISNVDNLRGLFMGSAVSEVRVEGSSAIAVDTYEGGSSKLRSLALDGVTFRFDKDAVANNDFAIGAAVQRASVVNCVFDGTSYLEEHGAALELNARAHHASGNIAINCGRTGADGHDASGRQAVVPRVGQPLNYEQPGPGSQLRPTWPVA